MDVFNLINNVSITLLVISPTVFVLGVTLLGNAIEKSKQEEKAARESESTTIKIEIENIEKSLNKAKKDGDTTEVYNKLEILKKRQEDTNKKIQEIKIKYNSINLLNTVIYPCLVLLLVLIFNLYNYFIYKKGMTVLSYTVLVSQVLLIFYSLAKIYKSLRLIEEISANKKESEQYDQMVKCIKDALTQHDQEKREELGIEFIDKAFPLNITCSTELKIKFYISLKKGNVLKDVEVWFFVPDGFDLIEPPEADSWRQASDFIPANIRTVKVELGKVTVGTRWPGTLKIKTPSISGKYSIRYNIKGEGYDGAIQEIKLIVG